MKKTFLIWATGVVSSVFVAALPLHAADTLARIVSLQGEVKVSNNGGSFQAATIGQEVSVGSILRTGAGARAVITPSEGTQVNVGQNTTFKVEELTSKNARKRTQIELRSGRVTALIDPKYSRSTDFRIRTPSGVAAARGTVYEVGVENGATSVNVEHGKVGFDFSKAQHASAN
jgi:hypothetical protein